MSEIVSSVITSAAIGSVCTLFFIALRRKQKRFYMPKAQTLEPEIAPSESESIFDWIRVTIRYPNSKLLLHSGGVDGILYLKLLKYSFWLFLGMSLIGCTALIPVYKAGTNNDANITGLDIFTAGHLKQGSRLYWVPLVTVFVFTAMCWVVMYKLYFNYVRYMNTKMERGSVLSRSVLVSNIPNTIENEEQFKTYWERLYPCRVRHVLLEPDLRSLEKLLKKRKELEKKLKKAEKPGKLKCCAPDDASHYKRLIASFDSMIEQEIHKPHPNSQVGVVTFTSTATAMQAAQTLHSLDPSYMKTQPAPDPRGLRFQNFHMNIPERFFTGLVTYFLLVVLFLFWTIPITFLSALSNLETLAKVPGLSFLVGVLDWSPILRGILDGLLPSLALIIFFALLPVILYAILELRGWFHQRHLDKRALQLYWLFLILNIFLGFTIGGSLFGAAEDLVENPTTIIESLARSLPTQAIFFINYVIVQAAVAHFLNNWARIPDFVLWKIGQIGKTTEEREKLDVFPTKMYFATSYSRELLVFAIGMTYSSIAPIILPFVVMYFGFAYFIARYNWIYVLQVQYEGARMSRLAVDRIFVALLLYQLTTMGVLGLGLFPYAPGILIPLIGSCVFRYILNHKFNKPSRYLALENCPDQPEIICLPADTKQYALFKHPLLRESLDDHQEADTDQPVLTTERKGESNEIYLPEV